MQRFEFINLVTTYTYYSLQGRMLFTLLIQISSGNAHPHPTSGSSDTSSFTQPNDILSCIHDELACENHEHMMRVNAIVGEFKQILSK